MGQILLYSALAGAATGFGAIITLIHNLGNRHLPLILGLAGGVMAAVVGFELFPTAWGLGGFSLALGGTLVGMAIISLIQRGITPYLERIAALQTSGERAHYVRMGVVIGLAIALHDIPEGLAIGAGHSAAPGLGMVMALAIGLHNIPEGMGMAAPLVRAGVRPSRILALTFLVGVATPIGTGIGLILTWLSPWWIGALLALASGAMLHVVTQEILPEAQRTGCIRGPIGLFLGFLIGTLLTYISH